MPFRLHEYAHACQSNDSGVPLPRPGALRFPLGQPIGQLFSINCTASSNAKSPILIRTISALTHVLRYAENYSCLKVRHHLKRPGNYAAAT